MGGGRGQGCLEPQRAKTTHTNRAGSQVEKTLRARKCLSQIRNIYSKEVTFKPERVEAWEQRGVGGRLRRVTGRKGTFAVRELSATQRNYVTKCQ